MIRCASANGLEESSIMAVGFVMLDPYAPPAASLEHASEGVGELADRGVRFGAALLDGAFYGVAALPLALVDDWFALGPLVALAIYQWYLISTRGQSLAKGWLHIRIVKMNGAPCGFLSGVLLRAWPMAAAAGGVGAAIVASGLDGLFMFGAERRCIHDLVAGTKVVRA
jgi:uncharacterized RDD family membrane protein YckC